MALDKPVHNDQESITLQVDTGVPAVFVLLASLDKMKFRRSVRVAPGVIVNTDRRGRLLAVELLGPADLDFVMTELADAYGAPALGQLAARRHLIEEVLASPVG